MTAIHGLIRQLVCGGCNMLGHFLFTLNLFTKKNGWEQIHFWQLFINISISRESKNIILTQCVTPEQQILQRDHKVVPIDHQERICSNLWIQSPDMYFLRYRVILACDWPVGSPYLCKWCRAWGCAGSPPHSRRPIHPSGTWWCRWAPDFPHNMGSGRSKGRRERADQHYIHAPTA